MPTSPPTTVLAADVGGTKTVLGLLTGPPWPLDTGARIRLENARYQRFEALLQEALDALGRPTVAAACVAVAGPVLDGEVRMTNLPWVLRAADIAAATGAARVRLLNDLEAAALGMLELPPTRILMLQAGQDVGRRGHVVVVAPGTGLGESILCWDGARHHPVASEGGHVDFAPRDEEQVELLRHLTARYGHVSYERILSGPGLVNLYEFLRDSGRADVPPALRDEIARGDGAAVVSRHALAGTHAICVRALDLFVRILGAKAGNLALEALAFGGVFLGGGIPARITEALRDGRFLEAFLDKGRHRRLLERMPVHVALDVDTAWTGAARFATTLAH